MIVKKLILNNYKRFFLSNIKELEYTPKTNIQFIIAKNGSGKSSLLSQLNPLPTDTKKDLYDTGYKYIEIEHKNKLYKLTSSTSSKSHSFILENKELNTSNNKRTQLELIKEHFNLTPAILEVLLNNNRFTNMAPAERKYWLSEMSNIDYSYPIRVYNSIKTEHRDLVGGIKLLSDQIAGLKTNIKTQEVINQLKQNKETINNYHDHILSLYRHVTDIDVDNDNLIYKTNLLKQLYDNLEDKTLTKDVLLLQKEDITIRLKDLDNKLTFTINNIKKIENVNKIGNKKDCEDRLEKIKNKIANIVKININVDRKLLENLVLEFLSLSPNIVSILNELKEYNSIRFFNKEELPPSKWKSMLEEISNKLLNLNKSKELILLDIKHIEEHKSNEYKTTCPECKHIWYNGYDTIKLEELKKTLTTIIDRVNKLSNAKTIYEERVELLSKYEILIDGFKQLILSTPHLKPLWSLFLPKININEDEVEYMLNIFNTLLIDLQSIKGLNNLLKEEEELEINLKVLKKIEEENININLDKIKVYEEELAKYTKEKQDTLKELEYVTKNLLTLEKVMSLYTEVKNLIRLHNKHFKQELVKLRNNYLMQATTYLKDEMMELDKQITASSHVLNKLEESNKLLEDYKKKEEVLGVILKKLSPTEGLIAKSMNSFLSIFIKEMNNIINSIWSYDVEILPLEINTEDDLDYKFKVRINNDEVIEDVSKLSSSLKEITDLAFRIVFMKYMKLQDYPLYLDEFGNTFDKLHRTTAYHVIEKILSSDFKQIFLICHFSDMYSSMVNAEFNILNTDNTDLSFIQSYNKNFKIT